MTTYSFREFHILQIFKNYRQTTLPQDQYLSTYFRTHKAIGSKDRAYIAETIYSMTRWQRLLDYLTKSDDDSVRLKKFLSINPLDYVKKSSIEPSIRFSAPKILYDLLCDTYGPDKTEEICLTTNSEAPITVRVNVLKTTRDALFKLWEPLYPVTKTKYAPFGISFAKRINFFALPEFKEGLFEIQDEGSQLLAMEVPVIPGEHILDFCTGSGGKTLALAPSTKGKGQIYLHDIRDYILLAAKKRLKRASIENFQFLTYNSPSKKRKLKKKMDRVLVDVPCSGTGTLRRNPDLKWKFSLDMLRELTGKQRLIFEQGLKYLKVGGTITYGTCSLLAQENEDQVKYFLEKYPVELIKEPLKTSLTYQGMDGFFAATFKKTH